MITATAKWDGAAALATVQAASWERLQRAVELYFARVLEALNVSNPRPYDAPSKPGEAPRKRTGWLQRHILREYDRKSLSARVGVAKNANYGIFLELGTGRMDPRPFLLGTLDKVKDKLRAIIEG